MEPRDGETIRCAFRCAFRHKVWGFAQRIRHINDELRVEIQRSHPCLNVVEVEAKCASVG
jgi:hypothetical protein